MKYITRNANDDENIINMNMERKSVKKLLKSKYGYIYDAMGVEGYTLHFDYCHVFKEIIFESKVVGFVTYNALSFSNLSLLDIFILPEFRGHTLFLEEIFTILSAGNVLSITQPSRKLVEILMHYDLAKKITDNLVYTAIQFEIPTGNLIYKYHEHGEIASYIYDLKLCSTLFLHDISSPDVCQIEYHEILKDDETYHPKEFRDSIDIEEYFENIKYLFLRNQDKFTEILMDLKKNLPKPYFNYDNVIGKAKGLSDYFRDMVNDGLVDYDRALEIQNQLKKEYKSGDVQDEGLYARILYLISGVDLSKEKELFLDNLSNTNILCPYCYQPISLSDLFCPTCGFNIEGGKTLNYDKVLEEMFGDDDHVIDLRGDKFNEFMDNLDDEDNQNEISDQFLKAYLKNDVELFTKLNEEYDQDFESIEDVGKLLLKQEIDLSEYLMGMDTVYRKNYSHEPTIEYIYRERPKHRLDEPHTEGMSYDTCMVLSGLEDNSDLDDVIDTLTLFTDQGEIKAHLFADDFIEFKNFPGNIHGALLDNYKVADYKEVLRNNHLKVSGNKVDLATRIVENGVYTELDGADVILSLKGEHRLHYDFSWIKFYTIGMEYEFDFRDFESYLSNHMNYQKFDEVVFGYLNEHLKRAYDERDYYLLFDVIASKTMRHIYNRDFKKALIEELKLFILKLNPIYLDVEERKSMDNVIDYDNIQNIAMLMAILKMSNVKKLFNRAWNNIELKNKLVPKKKAFRYLNRALDNDNFKSMSDEIIRIYFTKK